MRAHVEYSSPQFTQTKGDLYQTSDAIARKVRRDLEQRLEVVERNGGDDGARTRTRRFRGVAARAKWLCFQCPLEAAVHAVTACLPGSLARVLHGGMEEHACRQCSSGALGRPGMRHAGRIRAAVTAAERTRAAALYEAFLAGCRAKANELDDSEESNCPKI